MAQSPQKLRGGPLTLAELAPGPRLPVALPAGCPEPGLAGPSPESRYIVLCLPPCLSECVTEERLQKPGLWPSDWVSRLKPDPMCWL